MHGCQENATFVLKIFGVDVSQMVGVSISVMFKNTVEISDEGLNDCVLHIFMNLENIECIIHH